MNVYIKWGIVLVAAAVLGYAAGFYFAPKVSAHQSENVAMCHQTNSEGNPWVNISVNENAVQTHLNNGDFIIDETHPCPPEEVAPPEPQTIHINAQKIICPTEDLLPNWGAGGADITANTASDFVADNPTCQLSDWTFQFASSSVANPGDSFQGLADGWTNFPGVANIALPIQSDYLWVREVPQDGYVPFSGWLSNGDNTPNESDQVSAEMYCNTDVLNYDNYDRVDATPAFADGNTYYCVAFNAPTEVIQPPVDVCPNLEGDQSTVPEGMEINNDGNCVTPDTTPPPSDDNGGGGSSSNNGGGGGGAFFQSGCPVYADGQLPPWGVVPCATAPATPPTICAPLLTQYLRLGFKGNDPQEVKKLEGFLNLPQDGVFGIDVETAVRFYQLAHAQLVLTPWGLTLPTGIVYKTTRKTINEEYCATVHEDAGLLTPWGL